MAFLANLFVPLVVALVSVVLTAFVTIKVKFASDEKTATREVTRLFSKIAMFAVNGWMIFVLYQEFISPQAVTRQAVFKIVFYSIALFLWVVSYMFHRVLNLLDKMVTEATQILKNLEPGKRKPPN